ncbi:MAG: hypothetical protein IPM24_02920 [Bryobacterales bacterium]|nr:hypothetical protein [Bryobacterales bacterium]
MQRQPTVRRFRNLRHTTKAQLEKATTPGDGRAHGGGRLRDVLKTQDNPLAQQFKGALKPLGACVLVGVEHSADDGLAHAQAPGKFGLTDPGSPDGPVEGQLAGDPQRHGNQPVTTLHGSGAGHVRAIGDGERDRAAEAVTGFFHGFPKVRAVREGSGKIREADDEAASFIAPETGG